MNEVRNGDDDGHAYTFDEAIAAVGFGKFQVLALVYAGLGTMVEAMEVMILSFIGPSVEYEWKLSTGQESLITSVVFAGMLVGAYSWGVISDKYGRRIGLLSVAVVTSTFAILSAFSPNYTSLVLFRMILGFGLGGAPVYTSWFLEFVPVQNRGIWMVIFSTFWTIGTIIEASLAWIIMPWLGWRWLLILSSVPCFTVLVLYFLVIESPRYLYLNGRIPDALNVLKKMATINQTELPSGALICDRIAKIHDDFTPSEHTQFLLRTEINDDFTSSVHTQLLSPRKNKTEIFKSGFSTLLTLLSPSLLKTTLLLWVVYFGNTFSYYGIVLLTSELSGGQNKCSPSDTRSNKLIGSSIYMNVFITSFAELPGLIISALIVEKLGRRLSMVLMFLFCFIFMAPLMFHQKETVTTCLLFGARMFIIGAFTMAGVYCPEIYPTSVRTTGVGLASAVGRIAGMICPLVAVGLVSACHQMEAVMLFEAVIILSGLSAMLLPIETGGMELNDEVECIRCTDPKHECYTPLPHSW